MNRVKSRRHWILALYDIIRPNPGGFKTLGNILLVLRSILYAALGPGTVTVVIPRIIMHGASFPSPADGR